jgi:hypothetical protein
MTEIEDLHADLRRFRNLRAATRDVRTRTVLNEFIDATYARLLAVSVVANDR